MATRPLSLRGDIEEMKKFFLELLKQVGYTVILEEGLETGFRVIGADRARTSQLYVALHALVGGYVPKNRITIELTAHRDGVPMKATLKSIPYLDILDIETKEYTQSEQERCEKLVNLFAEQMLDKFS
jgi:hypothetical protein